LTYMTQVSSLPNSQFSPSGDINWILLL
jgi:hypothetical protein